MADQPTKEQWAEIERSLRSLHDRVNLRCDGFVVSATLGRISTTRLAIMVWVDGRFCGGWLSSGSDAPEARFYPLRSRMTRRYQYREVWWRTPKSFIRHLKSTCKRIEIVDADTAQAEIAAAKAQREARDAA